MDLCDRQPKFWDKDKPLNCRCTFFLGALHLAPFRQTKDNQARLLLLKRSVKSSYKTSSHCIVDRAPTNQIFVESLNIPPAVIQKYSGSNDLIGEGRYGMCTKVLIHGIIACAKTLRASSCNSISMIAHEATMLSRIRHPHICFLIGFQLITSLYSISGVSITVYDTFSFVNAVGIKKCIVESIRPSLSLSSDEKYC